MPEKNVGRETYMATFWAALFSISMWAVYLTQLGINFVIRSPRFAIVPILSLIIPWETWIILKNGRKRRLAEGFLLALLVVFISTSIMFVIYISTQIGYPGQTGETGIP